MLSAEFATFIEPTGVLDATDLAFIFRGVEIFLVPIREILQERCH
jgi:hypothetical protein